MRIFISVILIVWVFLIVPLMLDLLQYDRDCLYWQRHFWIDHWVEGLKLYIPGMHTWILKFDDNSDTTVTIKRAYHHWQRFFDNIKKTDIIIVGLISMLILGFIFSGVRKFQKRFIQKVKRIAEWVPPVRKLPELKPMEMDLSVTKTKEEPKAIQEGLDSRKADMVTKEEERDKKDILDQEQKELPPGQF